MSKNKKFINNLMATDKLSSLQNDIEVAYGQGQGRM